MEVRKVNRVYRGRLSSRQNRLDGFLPIPSAPHILKRVFPKRGTILIFPSSMKYRAMGKHMSRRWLCSKFKVKSIHFQSATWVATTKYRIPVDDDSCFTGFRSLCEPELFPGSRLISLYGGAKVNLFNSGKCICLGKLFHRRETVVKILSSLFHNMLV